MVTNQWQGRDFLQVLWPPMVPGLEDQRDLYLFHFPLAAQHLSVQDTSQLQPVGVTLLLAKHHCWHHTPTMAPLAPTWTRLGSTTFLGQLNLRYCLHVQDQQHRNWRDFAGGPLRLRISNAVGVNLTLIREQRSHTPHGQEKKKKQCPKKRIHTGNLRCDSEWAVGADRYWRSGAGTQRCHAWDEINCLVLDGSLGWVTNKGKNCGSGLQVLFSG